MILFFPRMSATLEPFGAAFGPPRIACSWIPSWPRPRPMAAPGWAFIPWPSWGAPRGCASSNSKTTCRSESMNSAPGKHNTVAILLCFFHFWFETVMLGQCEDHNNFSASFGWGSSSRIVIWAYKQRLLGKDKGGSSSQTLTHWLDWQMLGAAIFWECSFKEQTGLLLHAFVRTMVAHRPSDWPLLSETRGNHDDKSIRIEIVDHMTLKFS